MRTWLFIFLSVLSPAVVFAQQVTVSSTEEYTNQLVDAYWTRVLGQDESGYYLLREFGPIGSKTVVLEKYSPSLKPLFATNIEATTGIFNDARYHRYTEWNNGKVYVFLDGWNKAQQESSFHVQQVHDDGVLAENTILLETEPASSQSKTPHYSISFSPDGSKLAVLTEKSYEKGSKEKIRLQVFNTHDFSSLWKKEVTLENSSEKDANNTVIVDNGGIVRVFKDIRITRKEHRYQVITAGKDLFHVSAIDLEGHEPVQKKLLIDGEGNFIITGMLAPVDYKTTDWNGVWYCAVAPSGQVVHNKISPLGESLLTELVSQRQATKEGFVLRNYVLKDVLPKPSGGVLILTEEQVHRSVPKTGPGIPPMTMEHELHYGVGVVISLDAHGDRAWNVVLDKSQREVTTDPKAGFGSYAYQLKDGNLHLVWNFMEVRRDPPPLPTFRYWVDINRRKINIDNLFGTKAVYPTLLTVIDGNGQFVYDDRTFKSLPLDAIQKPNAFAMAVDPRIFFQTRDGLVILSHMRGVEAKRYKFSTIKY